MRIRIIESMIIKMDKYNILVIINRYFMSVGPLVPFPGTAL